MSKQVPMPKTGQGKKHIILCQQALDQALKDGFTPFKPTQPTCPSSAVAETARRLCLPISAIEQGLIGELIAENTDFYNPDNPHEGLIQSLRNAGIEVTDHDNRRARLHLLSITQELARYKKMLREVEKAELTAEEIREKIFRLKNHSPEIPSWTFDHDKSGKTNVLLPMTIWSDWHYGEVIDKRAMSGKNSFSLDIADHRIQRLVERIIDICIERQVNPNYRGIVVCLAGDLISGDGLHPELTETNEIRTIPAFIRLQGRLIWALEKLADTFGMVYVPCVVGNHGRNTDKPRNKLRVETNYEFLLFNQLELYFSTNPKYKDRVRFNIPLEAGAHFEIGGDRKNGIDPHKYYLQHGDSLGVRGGNAIVGVLGPIIWGGIKVAQVEKSIGRPFDTLLIGHYHAYAALPGIIANGCLSGWSEYARVGKSYTYTPPVQALWFSHPKYGPVSQHKIVLEDDGPLLDQTPSPFFPSKDGPKPQRGQPRKKARDTLPLAA